MLSIQRLKFLFVSLLWSETKFSISNGHSTIAEFIDCVGCELRDFFCTS